MFSGYLRINGFVALKKKNTEFDRKISSKWKLITSQDSTGDIIDLEWKL